jgi:[Skp1-protein]-hydroxyproline N-acetylglucosaminyltransferase
MQLKVAEIWTVRFTSYLTNRSLYSYTVESMFSKAKYPERIRLGVVDQLEASEDQSCDVPIVPCQQKPDQALCRYRDQIDVYEMEAKLAVGPTFARHVVNRMYRGEYYNLQIDSHTVFVKSWDVDLIEQLDSTGNEMAVITTYLADALGSIDDMSGSAIRKSRQVICNAAYVGAGKDRFLRHDPDEQPDSLPGITGSPQLQPFWAAGFSFSRGHFVLSVPYDPWMPMLQRDDEEISMGIRAFTYGYDFYSPERNVCFDSAFSDKDSRKSFLDHKHLYEGLEKASLKRMHGILGMEDEKEEAKYTNDPDEMFSIGTVRDLLKFWNSFGVHVRERITERKLCNFVSPGHMHTQFHEHLKADGMGLDYFKIAYRFHELQNNHET